jgi:hypothetical protein
VGCSATDDGDNGDGDDDISLVYKILGFNHI